MTLLELFALMREKIKLVVILPITLALITGIVSFALLPNEYTSNVSMYILTQSGDDKTADGITQSDLQASQLIANDIATLAESERLRESVAEELGMQSLAGYDIAVNSNTNTRIISLDVTGSDPESTTIIANNFAGQLQKVAVEVMDLEGINLIDEAVVPESPSGPPRLLYTAAAFILGLILAIMIIVLIDMFDTTIKDDEDIEENLKQPVIGRLPLINSLKKDENLLQLPESDLSLLGNASKTLFSNIKFSSPDDSIRAINITSSVANEGKTTAVILLASAIATAGHKVLLIEADMRRRSLSSKLKSTSNAGIFEVLSRKVPLSKAVAKTMIKNLYFLDCEPNIPNPSDLISNNSYKNLVSEAEQIFDYVIFDTPPVGTFVDAAALSELVDGTIFVIKAKGTKRDDAERALKQLQQANSHLLGVVLTQVEHEDSGYYYKYYSDKKKAKSKNKKVPVTEFKKSFSRDNPAYGHKFKD